MTTVQAGDYLDCDHQTVVRLWTLGHIEGYKTSPGKHGRLRLYRDSVEEYDRQRKSRPPVKK